MTGPAAGHLGKISELVGSAITTLVASLVIDTIAGAVMEKQLHEAQNNHAAAEGTWTPYQLRLERAERKIQHHIDQKTDALSNHADAEGVTSWRIGVGRTAA